jgi:hypothetical protein
MAFTIGATLLLLLLALITVAIILGLSMAMGWLVTLLLPFSLFEATLLTMVAIIIATIYWYIVLKPKMSDMSDEDFFDDDEADYDLLDPAIPPTRFYKSKADQTWESWTRFTLSNSIYEEIRSASPPVTSMGEPQQQELAVRLADAAVAYMKSRRKNAKNLTISMAALKRQLEKSGQQPYDNRIMQVAINGINYYVQDHMLDYIMIIQNNEWRQRCTLFENF